MPRRPKALVLTAEMAHQDPRVSWNVEVLSRHYDVTIAPGTDCTERESLEFYSRHHVLPCGRSRSGGFRRKALAILRAALSLPGIASLALRAALRDAASFREAIGMFSSKHDQPTWFFSAGRCLKMHLAVWPFIRAGEYEVVWCHEFITLPTGLRYKQLHPRSRIVWDEHEIGIIPPLARCQRLAAEACSVFVSVSEAILEHQIQSLPALQTKAHCIPNVPTITRPPVPAPTGDVVRWVVIGMESKHLIESMRHFLAIWQECAPPWCTLDCYIMQNTSRSYVPSRAFEDVRIANVTFHDPLPQGQLAERLRSYDVGVAPYRMQGIFRQACPNKVGEYIHAGLAVLINSDLEWYSGVIDRLGCGVSANIADPASACRAIKSLSDRAAVDAFKRRSCEAARASWNYDAAIAPVMARLTEADPVERP